MCPCFISKLALFPPSPETKPEPFTWDFLGGAEVKNTPANVGDVESILGSGRSPGVGNGESESLSVVSDSLWPQGLSSPWNSLGQNTGVGSLSLHQGMFPTQGSNPGLQHSGRFFTRWATRETQVYWRG